MSKDQNVLDTKKRMNKVREELKALGLVKLELWVDPADIDFLKSYDKRNLREPVKPGRKTDSKK